MAHWHAKFSNGTYLVLKKNIAADPYFSEQHKWIQIISGDAFNYYKIIKYTTNFEEIIVDPHGISNTEIHAFNWVEKLYEPSLSKTLKIL